MPRQMILLVMEYRILKCRTSAELFPPCQKRGRGRVLCKFFPSNSEKLGYNRACFLLKIQIPLLSGVWIKRKKKKKNGGKRDLKCQVLRMVSLQLESFNEISSLESIRTLDLLSYK